MVHKITSTQKTKQNKRYLHRQIDKVIPITSLSPHLITVVGAEGVVVVVVG